MSQLRKVKKMLAPNDNRPKDRWGDKLAWGKLKITAIVTPKER